MRGALCNHGARKADLAHSDGHGGIPSQLENDYELLSRIDLMVELAAKSRGIRARMTGGGFGGSQSTCGQAKRCGLSAERS